MSWFTTIGAGVGLIACAGYVFQDYLLYFPTIQNSRSEFLKPRGEFAKYFEEHFITTPDQVKLNIWLFRQPVNTRPTILFFHGNAGSMSFQLQKNFI